MHHLKFRRKLVHCLSVLLLFVIVFRVVDVHLHCRKGMREKFLPTSFSAHDHTALSEISGGQSGNGSQVLDLLAKRHHWNRIGSGREGEVFTYEDLAIKIYNEDSTPFRSCLPGPKGALSTRWPTEIPATLLLGGLVSQAKDGDGDEAAFRSSFPKVNSYFLEPSTAGEPPKWHLVTPFFPGGSLTTLAKQIRGSPNSSTPAEVDRRFRPALNQVLEALHHLHRKHGLCHDDVKLANLFVSSEQPDRWILGDLGNVREPSHRYHSSPIWTIDTPQLPDCRENDTLRMIKVYLQFIRAAVADQTSFDEMFLARTEPWSVLYGKILCGSSSALEARRQSLLLPPIGSDEYLQLQSPHSPDRATARIQDLSTISPSSCFGSAPRIRAARAYNSVKSELRVGMNDSYYRIMGMTWLSGIPVTECT